MEPQKKRRSVIDLNTKLNVLSQYESGKKCKNIAHDLGLNHTTIYSIIKDKDRITEAIKGDAPMQSTIITKHMLRTGPIHEMEKLLFAWIQGQNEQNIPLNTRAIKYKALNLFAIQKEKAGPECDVQFSASSGWLHRFYSRFATHKLKTSLRPQEFEPPGTEQQFIMEGISSVLQDRMCAEGYMLQNTNNVAHEVDNGYKRIKINKRHYDTVSNTSDSDDGSVYVNPQKLMQVCLKEDIPSNTLKIEPTDIDDGAHIIDKNKESSSEDTQTDSDSHSDPLTISEYRTLLARDSLNSCSSVQSPAKSIEINIANQSNISSMSINDKLDLIGPNISMASNSLNSPKSAETVKHMIPSSTLSSGVKRSQPCMSFKRRRYSLCEDSGSLNQQIVHAQGNFPKLCCCPEFHKELLKVERKESNIRCQLLEEERIACSKEHEARMRLIAMEERLVQIQLRKLQSELDERKNISTEVDQNVGEQEDISINHAHSNENDLRSSKRSSSISSNSKRRLQEVNVDNNSKTNMFDTIYVS